MGLIPPQRDIYYQPSIAMTWNPSGITYDWTRNSLEQQEASKQGWGVIGWHPLAEEDGPTIWEPTGPRYQSKTITVCTVNSEAWSRILEGAMIGNGLALRAFTDIVTSNPNFAEFKDTLKALTDGK